MHLIGPDPAKPRRQPVQVVLEKMEDSWALPHEDKGLVAFFAASCAATYLVIYWKRIRFAHTILSP